MPPNDVYTGYQPHVRKAPYLTNTNVVDVRETPTPNEIRFAQPATEEKLANLKTPIDHYTAADAGSFGVALPPAYLSGSADQGYRAADAGSLGLISEASKPPAKPATDYTAVDAGSFGVSLPEPYLSGASNSGFSAADAGSLGLIEAKSQEIETAEWYSDAADNTVVTSRKFQAGGEVDIPIGGGGAEVTVGAAVELQKNTYGDGSVVVKASVRGSLGTEVADVLGIKINGSLGTEYKFSNEVEAQEFIDAVSDAANEKFDFDVLDPNLVSVGPAKALAAVLEDNESNHQAYKGGLELEATLSAKSANSSIDLSGAAGVEKNFSNDTTTYHASLSGSAKTDLGLGDKFSIDGETEVKLTVDDEGNATELKIIGSVSGSAPVRGVVNSFGILDDSASASELENVIPGTKNKENIAAGVTLTIDLTEQDNPEATADLVSSIFGAGDQSFADASAELLDRAEAKVNIATTESGVVEVDADIVEFNFGNSEKVTVAAFGKPVDGDFKQLDVG